MIAKIQKFFSNIDPFLVICIISLVIITPIGFTVDRTHLEKRCNCGPRLYTQSNVTNAIPTPFISFLNESREIIELVVSRFYPSGNIDEWALQLKYTHDRGVKIHIVTDDFNIVNSLSSFCEVTYVSKSNVKTRMLVFFAQSDFKRTIYASRLFNDWSSIQYSGFLIDFPDCQSIAHDSSSLFALLKYYAEKGFPNLFQKKFLPGSSFPRVHHWETGSCSYGIWPTQLIPPGRKSVTSLLNRFFQSSNSNFSIFNPSLFPTLEIVEKDMPELLISEQIEKAAYSGSNIRILITNNSVKSYSILNSLMHFPNIHVKTLSSLAYTPLFYLHETMSGFIPMTFTNDDSDLTITFSMSIEDRELSAQLKEYFDAYWYSTKTSEIE